MGSNVQEPEPVADPGAVCVGNRRHGGEAGGQQVTSNWQSKRPVTAKNTVGGRVHTHAIGFRVRLFVGLCPPKEAALQRCVELQAVKARV